MKIWSGSYLEKGAVVGLIIGVILVLIGEFIIGPATYGLFGTISDADRGINWFFDLLCVFILVLICAFIGLIVGKIKNRRKT